MVDLLACPFCGDDGEKGRQTVTQMNEARTTFDRILCRCCGAMAPELNWQQRATKPSAQEEPFGYWSKFADGSVVFSHRLPTNPDYEDMPSKSIPLYATPTPHRATVHIIEPPDFDPRPGVTDGMSPDDLWKYACLVGYRYKLSDHDREQSTRAALTQRPKDPT